MEFIKQIVIKLAVYSVAILLGMGVMSAFGTENILSMPQFNWVTLIIVAVSFEIYGSLTTKRTIWGTATREENP